MDTFFKCVDRELCFLQVESCKLIPKLSITHDMLSREVIYLPKGTPFRKHFFSKKKFYDKDLYNFHAFGYCCVLSSDEICKEIREHGYGRVESWYWDKFFIENTEVSKAQVFYDEENDCVARKSTLEIRTKSGHKHYAVYDSDDEAKAMMNKCHLFMLKKGLSDNELMIS